MVFSLKYKPIKLSSNKIIYRPLVPINFNGKKEKIDIFGLLDSGSDITIIPIDLAEILEIEFIGDNEISGITNTKLKAKQGTILVTFGKGHEQFSFKIHVFVPLDKNFNKIVIGRDGFFDQFKITFNQINKRIEFRKANPKFL